VLPRQSSLFCSFALTLSKRVLHLGYLGERTSEAFGFIYRIVRLARMPPIASLKPSRHVHRINHQR
jgi:hypothetical protein